MKQLIRAVTAFALIIMLTACAVARAPGVTAVALGQGVATACPVDPPEGVAADDPGSGCVEAAGGSLSDGLIGVIKDAITLIPRMLGGALAAGANP